MVSRLGLFLLAILYFVNGNNSQQNIATSLQGNYDEVSSNESPSVHKMEPLNNLLTADVLSTFLKTEEFRNILRILKDEGSHVSLPVDSFNNTQEIIFAFLRLDLLSVVRRVLAQKPASVWFPAIPNLNGVCYNHLLTFFDSLVGNRSNATGVNETSGSTRLVSEEWALRMVDSLGKPSSGLFVGRLQIIGDYDQCVSTEVSVSPDTNYTPGEGTSSAAHFKGRYCRVRMALPQYLERRLPENVNTFWLDEDHLPININWGICVPDSCDGGDMKTFITKSFFRLFNLQVKEVTCFEDRKLIDDPGAVVVVFLLAFIAFLVGVCTVVHFYITMRDKEHLYSLKLWWFGDAAPSEQMKAAAGGDENNSRAGPEHGAISNSSPDLLQKTSGTPAPTPEGCTESGLSNDIEADTSRVNASGCAADQSDTVLPDKIDTMKDQEKSLKEEDKGFTNKGFEMYDLDLREGETAKEVKGDLTATDCICDMKDNTSTPIEDTAVDEETEQQEEKKPAPQPEESKASAEGDDSVGTYIIKGASLYTNFLQLMNTDTSSSKPTIRCLEGLKAISMAWVVLGHTYTFGGIIDETNIVYDNALEMTNIPHRLAFHIVGSAQFGVDTFFVICGCLVMFISLDKLRFTRHKRRFWTCFIFHRFWRLTPIYMIVLAVGTTLYDHVVHGPLKSKNLEEFHECKTKWWAHLLYINNFYEPNQKCMTWTWYLAVDMQLHVLSPLFIYPVYRNRRVGVAMIVCLLAVGMVSAFSSEIMYGGQFLLMDMNFVEYWSYVYTMPWNRVGAFAIGLLLGVLLRDLDNGPHAWELFLQRKWCRRLFTPVMWGLNAAVGICLLLITHAQWKHGSGHWGRPALAVFESLSRPLWSLAVAWVIFACNTGRAGPVANLLSWPPFVTLSRLAYSMYLLHPLIILCVVYSRRTAIYLHPDRMDQAYNYLGNLVLTHLFAVVLYLLVEAPLRSLDILWQPRRGHRRGGRPTSS